MTRDNRTQSALPLKEAVQNHIAEEKLTPSELGGLLAMQRDVLEEHREQKAPRAFRVPGWLLATAASTVLAVSVFMWQHTSQQALSRDIALEVAENHLKLKPMDLETQSMNDIRRYFSQLDFSPTNSGLMADQFALPEGLMIGGRYCSIQGITAAQLRYKGQDSALNTFYEVGYDEQVFGDLPNIDNGETPKEILVKGLKVTLLVEKGLLMALVKDM